MFSRRDSLLRQRLRESFVVTLDDGSSFRGLLCEVDESSLVLRDTVVLEQGRSRPVDGELVVPRARVSYMQRP